MNKEWRSITYLKRLLKHYRTQNNLLRRLLLEEIAENDYLTSSMHEYEFIQRINGEYSLFLNPPAFTFKTSHNMLSCTFSIKVNDIICIISDGKTKWIYFNSPQTNIDGVHHISDKLSFTDNIPNTCKLLDNSQIHLNQVSRFAAVNISYYTLDSERLILNIVNYHHPECGKIKITPGFVQNFISKKKDLESIISFQKKSIDSK